MLAEIKGVRKNRILVPLSALKRDSEGGHVFLLKDDEEAHRQSVISSSYIAGKVEITQGVKNGDKVIIRGFLGLSNGKAVKVSGDKGKSPNNNEAVLKEEIYKKQETAPAKSFTDTLNRIWNKVRELIKS